MGNSIIDLIIRIKNGYMIHRETIESPFSKFREAVLKKLEESHLIKKYIIETDGVKKKIIIELLYTDGVAAFTQVKLFSRPGQRMYVSHGKIYTTVGRFGNTFLSTPKGILSKQKAVKAKIGGELLFNVW
jgi:small subunit ribosomal protein S8